MDIFTLLYSQNIRFIGIEIQPLIWYIGIRNKKGNKKRLAIKSTMIYTR